MDGQKTQLGPVVAETTASDWPEFEADMKAAVNAVIARAGEPNTRPEYARLVEAELRKKYSRLAIMTATAWRGAWPPRFMIWRVYREGR